MSDPEPDPSRETGEGEDERVTAWRLHEFLELGVPVEDAQALAHRRDVDYHRLRDLVRAGATVDQALRIVA